MQRLHFCEYYCCICMLFNINFRDLHLSLVSNCHITLLDNGSEMIAEVATLGIAFSSQIRSALFIMRCSRSTASNGIISDGYVAS